MKTTKPISKGFKRLLATWQANAQINKPASRIACVRVEYEVPEVQS